MEWLADAIARPDLFLTAFRAAKYSHRFDYLDEGRFRQTGMANHKSAIKRIRQNEKRRAINRQNRSEMRTEIKKLRSALTLGDTARAQELLPGIVSMIDRSIQKGVVHRNAAARYKSRLTRHVNEAVATAASK
jgi:small subunit ribosomal protein S20